MFLPGLLLGVPNLFSTVFTLMVLRSVFASVVFPFINVTVISGATVAVYFIWRERLKKIAVIGLAVAAVSLVLLALK